MKRKFQGRLMVLSIILLLGAAGLEGCSEKKTVAVAPPPEVEIVQVVQKDVPGC